ncbi:DUF4142 domain-containing protein [Sinimarinibacterium flocculans]|uniref:DUF4142 domain-containing protein n=1 Tax=Sinimarinibacterium flocculans TaxID=985250 RepID=UPI002490EC1B|nr:DUF4142 domain-containing protein [Sinimarinibacterium flocculans]
MKEIRPSVWPLLLLVFGLAVSGLASAEGLDEDDVEFMEEAAMSGMFEKQAAEVATARGTHPQVLAFARMMIGDHEQLASELETLAQRKNVALPSTLDDDHREKLRELSEAEKGEDFDETYAEMMVDGHDETVETFEDAADDAVDSEVKALAAKALPTLKMHKEHAEKLDDLDG